MNSYFQSFISAHEDSLSNFEQTIQDKFHHNSKQKRPTVKINEHHAYLGKLTEHHLVPRRRIRDHFHKGLNIPNNRIRIWELRHTAWHLLFKNLTLNEIIGLFKKNYKFKGYGRITWKIIFKERTYDECLEFLVRIRRAVRKEFARVELNYKPEIHIKKKRKNKPRHKKSP